MQVFAPNDVKIYSITSAAKSAIPDWLAKQNKKSLKLDQDFRRRIDLIQDFEFPEASLKIKASRDGKYLLATGVYQPRIKVFELDQLSMKFERHTDAENVQFEILSDDWTKTILLQSDRTIELHSAYGLHYKARVPKFGRDMAYHYPTCDLMVVGASDEVWRLNLDLGRFNTSLCTNLPGINVCQINPANQLFGFGGSNGFLEFWHPREKRCLGSLDVASAVTRSISSDLLDSNPEITCLTFGQDGLSFSVGTSTGQVLLYDLRRPTPVLIKDHQYGFPIKSCHFNSSGHVISADTKIIKIWDKNSGNPYTSIEPQNDINDVCLFDNSGLLMIANEGPQVQSYYIPSLGPAPKWCPFLDNLTEEMEENPNQTIYDDYKFVTAKELEKLELSHLIGTNMLKAYMHGFFIDLRLYEKAKAVANPFEYEEYKKRMIASKIQKSTSSRISARKKLPKVNQELAKKILKDQTNIKKSKNKVIWENGTDENPIGDSRFADIFKDSEFQVDETSHEYKIHHPTESKSNKPIVETSHNTSTIKDYDLSDPESVDSFYDSDDASSVEESQVEIKSTKKPKSSLKQVNSGQSILSILSNKDKNLQERFKTFEERLGDI